MACEKHTPEGHLGTTMEKDSALGLREELLAAFRRHNLDVGVGITANDIVILSWDERVDAINIDEDFSLCCHGN